MLINCRLFFVVVGVNGRFTNNFFSVLNKKRRNKEGSLSNWIFSMIEKDKRKWESRERGKRKKTKGASTFCIFPPATHSWFSDIILMEGIKRMGEIPGRMNHSQSRSEQKMLSKWHGNDYLETAGQPFSDEKLLSRSRRPPEKRKKKKKHFCAWYFRCVSLSHAVNWNCHF